MIFFLLVPKATLAIYDPLSVPNNRFGIHILETQELEKAAQLVNSSGGDWGYITIPIRANDRDLTKWTAFMVHSRQLHLIPILRLASFGVSDHWMAPNEYDLIDFANFLNELSWPAANRYIIIYNEPNHKNEWGGFVYPQEYARILDRAIDIFHSKNQDFFVISAGMDASAPTGPDSLNEYDYLRVMNARYPGIFNRVDGFSTHSYGNPGFSSSPSIYQSTSVANYRFEENFLSTIGATRPKIFITEAGWVAPYQNFLLLAYSQIWIDDNIVAVTPFLLSAQSGPFADFSFTDQNGNFKPFAQDIQKLDKIAGRPNLSQNLTSNSANIKPLWTGNPPPTSPFDLIASLKAVFSLIFPLQK